MGIRVLEHCVLAIDHNAARDGSRLEGVSHNPEVISWGLVFNYGLLMRGPNSNKKSREACGNFFDVDRATFF
jgi:hypothetical protein